MSLHKIGVLVHPWYLDKLVSYKDIQVNPDVQKDRLGSYVYGVLAINQYQFILVIHPFTDNFLFTTNYHKGVFTNEILTIMTSLFLNYFGGLFTND